MKMVKRSAGATIRSEALTARLAIMMGLGIALLGCLTYLNGLGGPFVWDDQTAIVTNQTIRSLRPLSGPLSPPSETPVAGRPIANFSLALNYRIGQLSVTGYHAFNIAVHILGSLVLFGIVRRTLEKGAFFALAVSLFWMLHPIQTEAVDYITQRTESMMGLFFFLTLYCAIRARRSSHANRWTAAAIASCALGMATKESMVVVPIVVLLYDRVFEFGSIRDAVRARKSLYTGLALTWLILAVMILRTARLTGGVSDAVSVWTYALNQVEMIGRYLGLVIWPRALVLDYGLPRAVSLREIAPQAVLIGALLAGTIVALRRWPKIGFLGAVFFLTLAPTSSLVPSVSEVGAERRMYVPMAAVSVLVVAGGWAIAHRSGGGGNRPPRMVAGGIAVCMLAALAAATVQRNAEYAKPLTLWQTVVERRPHGRARLSYAIELVAAGRRPEAMTELREAVRDFPDARFALGVELAADGHEDEAVLELQEFIRGKPEHSNRIPARLMLADHFLSKGRLTEAEHGFRTVLDQNAGFTRARQGLIEVSAAHRGVADNAIRRGDPTLAEAHARDALRLDSGSVPAHNLLGVALASQGKYDLAVAEFEAALRLAPDNTQARNNLARARALTGPSR